MYGAIYKIENIINKKVYIGRTSISINKRWNNHLYELRHNKKYCSNPLFQDDFNKYGEEAFKQSLIVESNDFTEETLKLAEDEYIYIYDSYIHGYNNTVGNAIAYVYKDWKTNLVYNTITNEVIDNKDNIMLFYSEEDARNYLDTEYEKLDNKK